MLLPFLFLLWVLIDLCFISVKKIKEDKKEEVSLLSLSIKRKTLTHLLFNKRERKKKAAARKLPWFRFEVFKAEVFNALPSMKSSSFDSSTFVIDW